MVKFTNKVRSTIIITTTILRHIAVVIIMDLPFCNTKSHHNIFTCICVHDICTHCNCNICYTRDHYGQTKPSNKILHISFLTNISAFTMLFNIWVNSILIANFEFLVIKCSTGVNLIYHDQVCEWYQSAMHSNLNKIWKFIKWFKSYTRKTP